jgi:endonuclease/exonuclease/phosphatase (EEP) superfamily protein YafD
MNCSRKKASYVKVLQVNLNRQDVAFQSALEHALEIEADIVLFQEPYTPKNHRTGGFIGLQHSAFYTVTPQPGSLSSIGERPRVLTYIRKAAELEFTTRYDLCCDPDLQIIQVSSAIEPFYIANVYNEQRLVEGSRQYTVNRLLRHMHFDMPAIIAGDFNAHYS